MDYFVIDYWPALLMKALIFPPPLYLNAATTRQLPCNDQQEQQVRGQRTRRVWGESSSRPSLHTSA